MPAASTSTARAIGRQLTAWPADEMLHLPLLGNADPGVFVLVSGVMYFAFMAAWLNGSNCSATSPGSRWRRAHWHYWWVR